MIRKRPGSSGRRIIIDGASLTLTHANADAAHYNLSDHATLFFFTTEPKWQIRLNSDRPIIDTAPAGTLGIYPAQSEVRVRWSAYKHSLRIDLSPDRLKHLAGVEFGTDDFVLHPPKTSIADQDACALAYLMRAEMHRRGKASREVMQSASTMFAINLLRKHSSLSERRIPRVKGGLRPNAWRNVREFIEENIATELSVERLAAVSRLSSTHFLRAFKRTAGQTPHQYVISVRLARARWLIETTDLPLQVVAKSAGFSSHSHLTATMKQHWNITPSQLERRGLRIS